MTILSQLLQKLRKDTLMIYTAGTLFQLTPGAYLSRPAEGFVYRNNGMDFMQKSTDPLDTFSDAIVRPIQELVQTEMNNAEAVASSLQKKYEALKAKSEGKNAPDITIPQYTPVDLNKRLDELAQSFPYTTVGLYRDHVIHFSQKPARKPAPTPHVLYGTREWGLSPLFNLRDIMQDELSKNTSRPDSALHKNDHLKDRILLYQFYLDNIFRKDDEYELKIREVGNEVQVYIDVPEHLLEDVLPEDPDISEAPLKDPPWYLLPPTQTWMTLEISKGRVLPAKDRAYLPTPYMHPFNEPKEGWVCVSNFEGLAQTVLDENVSDLEKLKDPGKYIRWTLKTSMDALLYGFTPTCVPWRPFRGDYESLYAKFKVDKKACTRVPDNRRE